MSNIKTLTKLSAAVAVLYGAAVPTAFADIQSANSNTQVDKHNGVDVVRIANPNEQGLSHNQYNKFNVDKAGAVLNNSLQDGKSQLAGDLKANTNLQSAAKVILNEVVSRSPSVLAGAQEIFGNQADYILANPNGISYNGAGFINTPRASLVVGTAEVNGGKVSGFNISGDNGITGAGQLKQDGALDLLAPTVSLSGNANVKGDLNVVMGRGKIGRADDGEISVDSVSEAKNKVLDGKVAGSIQAGRIRLHAVDKDATVNVDTANIRSAGDITLVAEGNLNVQGKTSTQVVAPTTQHQDLGGAAIAARRHHIYTTTSSKTATFQGSNIEGNNVTLQAGKKLNIVAGNVVAKGNATVNGQEAVDLNVTKTINASSKEVRQSKRDWHRNETDTSSTETVHTTNIKAGGAVAINSAGSVTSIGAKVSGDRIAIDGDKAVKLNGTVATKTESSTADFARETAKLKTGNSKQDSSVQTLVATELTSANDLSLTSKSGKVYVKGAKAKVDGNLAIEANKVQFGAVTTKNTHNLIDNHKFWGGIAGGKNLGTGKNETLQKGADFTVAKSAAIKADNGVKISGSRVVAAEDAVVASKAGLVIDDVKNNVVTTEDSRKGTIFNITKARVKSYDKNVTSSGSSLKSDSNLKLVSDKDVKVVGSKIEAVKNLDVQASNVSVEGGQNNRVTQTQKSGFGWVFSKPELKMKKNIVAIAITEPPTISTKTSGLNIYNNKKDVDAQTYSGAELAGGNVNVQATNVNVAGSNVTATAGNVSIQAKDIKVSQQTETSVVKEDNLSVLIGPSVTVSPLDKSGSIRFGVDVSKGKSTTETGSAHVSGISASNDVTLIATNNITHQGSNVKAGNTVAEVAKNITHGAAESSVKADSKDIKVGVGITVSGGFGKDTSVGLGVSASGERKLKDGTGETGGSIVAKNIVVNAQDKLTDVGTQYQGTGEVALNSANHDLKATSSKEVTSSTKGNAGINLTVSTKDFTAANVAIGLNAGMQKANGTASSEVAASVVGGDVTINTGKLYSQANINGTNSAIIKAKDGAQFDQLTNTQTEKSYGFTAGVKVGASINAAGAIVPSVSVDGSGNGRRHDASQGGTTTIEGGNVTIESQEDVKLKGTNLVAKDITARGKTVTSEAAEGHTNTLGIGAGAGFSLGGASGGGIGKVGLRGNFDIEHEKSVERTGVAVKADNNLTLEATKGDITLKGASGGAKNTLTVTTPGNLNLDAAKSVTNATKFGIGLGGEGGKGSGSKTERKETNQTTTECTTCGITTTKITGGQTKTTNSKWASGSANAHLDIDVKRNQEHAVSNLTNKVSVVNVGGNANLTGSTLKSEEADINIAGKVNTTGVTNKVREFNLEFDAAGRGHSKESISKTIVDPTVVRKQQIEQHVVMQQSACPYVPPTPKVVETVTSCETVVKPGRKITEGISETYARVAAQVDVGGKISTDEVPAGIITGKKVEPKPKPQPTPPVTPTPPATNPNPSPSEPSEPSGDVQGQSANF